MSEVNFGNSFEKLFGGRPPETTMKSLPREKLVPWKDPDTGARQPFKVNLEQLEELQTSIQEFGILEPLIIRPQAEQYQILSGERRWTVAGILGMENVPCIIKDIDDNEARKLLVHMNIKNRQDLLPSERAGAYLLEYTARKNQGQRTDLYGIKEKTEAGINDSIRTIQRYIRLNYLTPELLALVDFGKIQVVNGVSLSYMSEENQTVIHETVYKENKNLTTPQLKKLSEISKNETLTVEIINDIINTPKVKHDRSLNPYRIYFRQNCPDAEIKNTITKLLEDWRKENLKEILDKERS